MADLLDKIQTIISADTRDLVHIERTLTDGYAEALALEAERWRLERRIAQVTQGIQRGDTAKKARELASLSRRLDGTAGDLSTLRRVLADLRRHASDVRVAEPSA
jgi:predicted  nucleic acid-binding Zn-ribbon protein